jgi:5-methyltetrahydropteroyltriglutamate--homocysteine methyltransferase
VTVSALPILPTTVVGSYAIPAWLWAAYEKIGAGGFGAMDVAETENDAVATAVRDQERAGVDLISDGEMRRQGFIVSIFKYFHGLRPLEPRRKVGILSYDGHVL